MKKNNISSDWERESEKGYMFSMIGNLPSTSKPFKIGDRVYFKGNGLFHGEKTEDLIIKEIQYGKGGYMVFEGQNSGEITKKKYDEVLDEYDLIPIINKEKLKSGLKNKKKENIK